jgi:glycosyltransferase involved in cell wall biosynthesis
MTTPAVSVCIATYNRSSMVRQAIDAAFAQTLPPAEIIVTDDASTDSTWRMLNEYAAREPKLRIFRHEKNTGGVENWNCAIRQTSSPYIAWCSDDDRFLPDHLAASVAYLEAHPSIGLVHAGFLDAVESETAAEVFERPLRFPNHTALDRDGLLTYLTRYYDWPFHPSTIVMRREVWNHVGAFDPKYALADTDWFVRVVEAFPIAMLATRGVLNRRHPGNWSNRLGSAAMQREIFTIVEGSIHRLHPSHPVTRAIWKCIWRNNVRARLLLTLRARAASGHADAACAAWTQLIEGTRLPLPRALRNLGEALIRAYSTRKTPVLHDARQSVSPL